MGVRKERKGKKRKGRRIGVGGERERVLDILTVHCTSDIDGGRSLRRV